MLSCEADQGLSEICENNRACNGGYDRWLISVVILCCLGHLLTRWDRETHELGAGLEFGYLLGFAFQVMRYPFSFAG